MHPSPMNFSNCFLNQGLAVPEPPCSAELHNVIKSCMKKENSFLFCF